MAPKNPLHHRQLWLISLLKRFSLDEEHLFFALTLFVGTLSGIIAFGIGLSIETLTEYFGTSKKFDLKALCLGLGAVSLSGWITTRLAPSSSGSGIPNIKLSLVALQGAIPIKDTIAKLFASILSLSSGLSLGREGPTVAVCAGLASFLGKSFSLSKRKIKTLVAIGATGGIAAAFNTPIAAVIFTLEEIVGNLNAKILGPVVISSVIAAVIASAFHGSTPNLAALDYQLGSPVEILFYLCVGLCAAIAGPLFVQLVVKMRKFNRKLFKSHRLTLIIAAFFLMAGFSFIEPRVLGSGHETITTILTDRLLDWKTLALLFSLKFILTSACYSSGVSGGLFLPTLFLGASLGALIGTLFSLVFPEMPLNIGAFALVGMTAFFASVIRAPFTSILIIFEMTHDVTFIVPLMVAGISAYLLSSRINSSSIYENISEQDGIHLPGKEDYDVLESLVVEDAMIKKVETLKGEDTLEAALETVNHSEISGYPIVDEKGLLVGVVSTYELARAYGEAKTKKLKKIFSKKVITVYPDQSLLVAFHKLNKYKVSRLIVVSRLVDRKILGIITAQDIVHYFGFHIQEESKADVIDKTLEMLKNPKQPDKTKS